MPGLNLMGINGTEEWRDLIDFPQHQVSSLARVRNLNGKILSPFYKLTGPRARSRRLMVTLRQNGKKRNIYLHRLVALAFCAQRPGATETNHIDGNTLNNLPDNLEWTTKEENNNHRRLHQLWFKGTECANYKIDPSVATALRLKGNSLKEIGRYFNASTSAVRQSLLLSGTLWPDGVEWSGRQDACRLGRTAHKSL